jgi:hypothetical protein
VPEANWLNNKEANPSRAHLELNQSWKRISVCSLLKKEVRKNKNFILSSTKRESFCQRLGKAEHCPQDDSQMNPLLLGRKFRKASSDEL